MENLSIEQIDYLKFLLSDRIGYLQNDKPRNVDYEEIEQIREIEKLLRR